MLVIEIALGVVLGLFVFGWILALYRRWDERRTERDMQNIMRVIAAGMPSPDETDRED